MDPTRILVIVSKKVIGAVITIYLVMSILFLLLHSVPGGDLVDRMNPFAPEELKEQIREEWGLNNPLSEQCLIYIKKIFTLDFTLTEED